MARITLDDGRSVEMRTPVYVSEKLAIVKWEQNQEATPALELFAAFADIIRPAIRSTSWGGDVLEMSELQLVRLIADWTQATEDEAVGPEASGTSSETP